TREPARPRRVNRLWAPWRLAYVSGAEPATGCVFCEALRDDDDRRRFVLHRGRTAFLILNAYPYAPGHVMAVLNRHVGSVEEATPDELGEAMRLVQQATAALRRASRQGAQMAGIPQHAAEAYIARLVRAGQKVALCEQMEAPGRGKKLLRREVVRIITPGTVTDTAFLEGAANNFLLALVQGRAALGLALTDISTGEFWIGEGGPELLDAALVRRPAEILLPSPLREEQSLCDRLAARGAVLTFCDPATFALRPGV